MDLIYHGCFTKNADGTNRIIGLHQKCVIPTNRPFWKDPEDIHSPIKTRNQYANQSLVSIRDYRYYFQKKRRLKQ